METALLAGQVVLALGLVICVSMVLAVAKREGAAAGAGSTDDDLASLLGCDISNLLEPSRAAHSHELVAILSDHCSMCRAEANGALKALLHQPNLSLSMVLLKTTDLDTLGDSPLNDLAGKVPTKSYVFGDRGLGELSNLNVVPTFLAANRGIVYRSERKLQRLLSEA